MGIYGGPFVGSSSIAELVKRAQKGSEEAISDLISLFQFDLYRFCVYLTKTPHEAEDLTQDVFLKVLKNIKKVKKPEMFKSWLFQSAKNLFLDRLKATQVRQKVSREKVEQAMGITEASNPERVLELQKTLEKLAPEDRLLILLVDQQGYSYGEVADLFGLSESAVTSRIYRVRQHIRNDFEKKERN